MWLVDVGESLATVLGMATTGKAWVYPQVAWVAVDLQHGGDQAELEPMAERFAAAVATAPGPVWATLREDLGVAQLLDPVAALEPVVLPRNGFFPAALTMSDALAAAGTVFVGGADTDGGVQLACVGLLDAGVNVYVRTDLCWSAGGQAAHTAGLAVLRRLLGAHRLL